MKTIVLLTGIAFTLIGCVHSRALRHDSPPDTLAQVNRDFENHAGQIKVTSGHHLDFRTIQFDRDSLTYLTDREENEAISITAVEYVRFRDYRRGSKEGLVFGAGLGAGVGAVVGVFINNVYLNSGGMINLGTSESNALLYGALGGAVSGAILGTIIGGKVGSVIEARYRPPAKKAHS